MQERRHGICNSYAEKSEHKVGLTERKHGVQTYTRDEMGCNKI